MKQFSEGNRERKVTGLTGRKYLAATSSLDQYRDLMDAGVRVAGKFSLSLGIALTEAQIAALDEDIVWMVEKTIGGEKLLVPVVYLSAASANKYRLEGATIAANDVYLNATGTVTNHGNIQAGNTLAINARDLVNSGALTAGGVLYANASNDIINRNGTLSGGTVQLVAGNDVLSKTQIAWGDKASTGIHSAGALTLNAGRDIELAGTQVTAKGTTTLDAGRNLTLTASQYTGLPANAAAASVTSSLNTTGDALLTAKQDLTLNRSTVNAGGTAALIAGRDLTISSGAGAINATTPTTGGAPVPGVWLKGHSTTTGHGTQQQLEVAGVNAGSQLVLSAGRDAHLNAAQVTAGEDLTVIAKRDINASTVATTDTHTTTTVAKKSSGWITQVDQTAHGTLLGAQGNVTLNAGQDVSLQGASVNAKTGEASISAVRDVNLTAAQETHETHSQTTKKSGNFWNDTETRTFDTVKDSIAVGTTVSGETVKIKAGNDVLVQGGQVVGTKDVAVTAGNDLKVLNATNTREEDHRTVKTTEGVLYSGGISVMKGVRQTTQDMKATETSTAASVIGSSEGRVDLYAGNAVQVKGSDVLSQAGTSISGKTVTVEANEEVRNQRDSTRFREDGAKIALTGNYANIANTVVQTYNDYKSTENDRLKALYAASGAYSTYKGGKEVFNKKATNDKAAVQAKGASQDNNNTDEPKGGSNWGITITGSHQQSDTHVDTQVTSQRGSVIKSAGDIDITAREGDLKVIGSTIDGQNVTLDAAKNLILQSSESAMAQKQKTESWGAEAGVALTFGNGASVGFYGAANVGNDKTEQNNTTHNETIVNAAKTLTLKSGGDTTLQGAQAKGEKVVANVGGNLNLISEQDSDKFRNTNWSISGSVTIGYGFDYSLNASAGKIKSDYASVQEKTGIAAGKEGFDITVGGNTHLKGADIASQADADKNRLSTNSLTVENIENKAKYSAMSVSGGTSGGKEGSGGNAGSAHQGGQKGSSTSGGMSVPQNKDETSTTTSGIAQGSIEIRNGDNSVLASLDRDVKDLSKSNALKPIFDLQDVKDTQKAGEVAGRLSFEIAGDIAKAKTKAYTDAELERDAAKAMLAVLESNKSPEEKAKIKKTPDELRAIIASSEGTMAANQATYGNWKDGSTNKIILHAIAGAVTAVAGGGNATGGAIGAAFSESQAATTEGLSKEQRMLLSTLLGSVGGGSGASAALNGEQYNRQLHLTEQQLIREFAYDFAKYLNKGKEPSEEQIDEARGRLSRQALQQVDTAWGAQISGWDKDAEAYLKGLSNYFGNQFQTGGGQLFDARGTASYRNNGMNSQYMKQGADLYSYAKWQPSWGDKYFMSLLKTPVALAEVPGALAYQYWMQAKALNGDPNAIAYFSRLELGRDQRSLRAGFETGVDLAEGGPKTAGTLTGWLLTGGIANVARSEVMQVRATAPASPVSGSRGAGFVENVDSQSPAATSANSAVGLREQLSRQAGVPTGLRDVWGATLDQLKTAFDTRGAVVEAGTARRASTGNAQILEISGRPDGLKLVQFSPANPKSAHKGQYYKFAYENGSEVKVIDPKTYNVTGWPENKGRTTYRDTKGRVITYDPVTKTWK